MAGTPITLTKAQFGKTAAAKAGGTFAQYQHYLAIHRAKLGLGPDGRKLGVPDLPAGHPAAAAVDPLAPDPNIGAEAAAAVRAQTAPIIASIQADYARQQKAGASAIAAGGKTLMDAFAQYAPAEKAAYGQAESQMGTLNTDLANRLTGQGTALQGELSAKLAAINAPGAQQQAVAVGTGAIGAGAANAGFARGAANISDLIARSAAAQDYGAKLPGIGARIGMTNLRNLAAQTEADRAKAVGAVRAQIPGMVSSQLGQLRTQELNKAIFRANTDKAQTAATTAAQPMPDPSLSNTTGYLVDQYGTPILGADGKPVPTASSPYNPANKTNDTAKKAAATKKARQSAVSSASGAVVSVFQGGSTIKTTDPLSGVDRTIRVKIGSPAYNRVIHQAAAAVSDALSPYMTPQQIIGWVQQKAKPFFAPPKKGKPSADPMVNPNAAGPPAPGTGP